MTNKSSIKRSLIGKKFQFTGIIFLIFNILEGLFFGTKFTLFLWGGLIIFIGIYYFYKLDMIHFLIVGVLFGTAAWHYFLTDSLDLLFTDFTFFIHLLIAFLVGAVMLPKMKKASKLAFRARQLFQLAAQQVFEVSSGFTDRPYTGGKTNAERKEVLGLARYMVGENIVVFESDKDIIKYAFSMNISPLAVAQLDEVSNITFDRDGNISIHISEKDYQEYKNQLSFDQLCASFSTLFKQFLEYYKEGNEDRIKNELKSV